MGRPAIVIMVVNGSVCYFIAFFTRKFPRKKQVQGRWIKFIQPEMIIGRRVLYNVDKIKKYLDAMAV
nr:hypothetical protein [uncultured Blautia sp.]